MHEGTMEAGAWSCGMVAGLVNDIPTVQDLINNIMSQANEIISSRLQKI
jgi:NAD(P)H-dependent flavin oxidoreductase YrpB (nitropropane dioxygenase family)